MTNTDHGETADELQFYAQDLDLIGSMAEEWLRDLHMTYRLHSALKDVWKVVEIELLGIRDGALKPQDLYAPTAESSAFMDQTTGFTAKQAAQLDRLRAACINHNGKRERTPDESHDENEGTVKFPRRSSRLSTSLKSHVAAVKEASSSRISHSPRPVAKKKQLKVDLPRNHSVSRQSTVEVEHAPKVTTPGSDLPSDIIFDDYRPTSTTYVPTFDDMAITSTQDFDSPSETPKSRSRAIPTQMAEVIEEIRQLDALPSSMPIGTATDSIASNIAKPCSFPSPTDYDEGELWENIDCEFLNVMGKDVLDRGDLRRGPFGVLGIVDWILDAREYPGWDDICEEMVLGKFKTLLHHLKKASLQEHRAPPPTTILASPANSTATLVGRDTSPAPFKQRNESSFKGVNIDIDITTDRSDIHLDLSSLNGPEECRVNAMQEFFAHRPGLQGIIRRARSETPPSDTDTETEPVEQQGPAGYRVSRRKIRHLSEPTLSSDGQEVSQELPKSSHGKTSRLVNVLIPYVPASSASLGAGINSGTPLSKVKQNSPLDTISPNPGVEPSIEEPLSLTSDTLVTSGHSKQQLQIEGPVYSPNFLKTIYRVTSDNSTALWLRSIQSLEIHQAQVLLEALSRGSCTYLNLNELLKQLVGFSSSGQPGIRQWCERPRSKLLTSGSPNQESLIEGPVYSSNHRNTTHPVTSDNTSSSVSVVDISSCQSQVSSQPQPLPKSSLWLQKTAIYQSISVTQNSPQPAELPEIHKATRVLLEALIRGSCTNFNPDELLRQPVSFSSSGQPGIRQWCERPENRELFTPSLETLWYKPENFNFDVIAKSDPPDSMPRHERFLWNTLKHFYMPTATFIERGMHYVLAALVLIGTDAEHLQFSQALPDVTPISRGARSAFSCWHHYKTLSSARWAKIGAKKAEATADGCIEDLDKLIATIYTMVETFASIWALTSLKTDIEATERLIRGSQSIEDKDSLTSGLEQMKKVRSQIKVKYNNLPALVGFLCSGVKGLMVYPSDLRVFGSLRAINFLLVTSHLARCDESISEAIWKRTQSYIVGFLKSVVQSTEDWVPQELNRYHLAKALFLDFADYCISRDMTTISIPKCRNYRVNEKIYQ